MGAIDRPGPGLAGDPRACRPHGRGGDARPGAGRPGSRPRSRIRATGCGPAARRSCRAGGPCRRTPPRSRPCRTTGSTHRRGSRCRAPPSEAGRAVVADQVVAHVVSFAPVGHLVMRILKICATVTGRPRHCGCRSGPGGTGRPRSGPARSARWRGRGTASSTTRWRSGPAPSETIAPHSGDGGGGPRPRKLSDDAGEDVDADAQGGERQQRGVGVGEQVAEEDGAAPACRWRPRPR